MQSHPEYGHLTFDDADDAQIVQYHAPDGTVHRTHRFSGWSSSAFYVFHVDTNTGALVGVVDRLAESGDVSGAVRGYATFGRDADGPMINVGMPFLNLRQVPGPDPACPIGDDGNWPNWYADAEGLYSDPSAFNVDDNIAAGLADQFTVDVLNCEGGESDQCIVCRDPVPPDPPVCFANYFGAIRSVMCADVQDLGPQPDLVFNQPLCVGGGNDGGGCAPGVDCPAGACQPSGGSAVCVGGSNHGQTCDPDADCPNGSCGWNEFRNAEVNAYVVTLNTHDNNSRYYMPIPSKEKSTSIGSCPVGWPACSRLHLRL